jgi:hypothetical protein
LPRRSTSTVPAAQGVRVTTGDTGVKGEAVGREEGQEVEGEVMLEAELEARLLANESDEYIAGRCNLSPAAVHQYHELYFGLLSLIPKGNSRGRSLS